MRHLPAREMLRRVLPLLRPHGGALAAGLALLLLAVAAELAGPLVLRHLIDVDIADGSRDGIVRSAVIYAALFVAGTAANYFQVVVLTRMNRVLDLDTFATYEPQQVRLTTRDGRIFELDPTARVWRGAPTMGWSASGA